MEVRGEEGIAALLVDLLLMRRVSKELVAIFRERWRLNEANLDSKFSKKTNGSIEGNMEKTMKKFINATADDKDFIILHM